MSFYAVPFESTYACRVDPVQRILRRLNIFFFEFDLDTEPELDNPWYKVVTILT